MDYRHPRASAAESGLQSRPAPSSDLHWRQRAGSRLRVRPVGGRAALTPQSAGRPRGTHTRHVQPAVHSRGTRFCHARRGSRSPTVTSPAPATCGGLRRCANSADTRLVPPAPPDARRSHTQQTAPCASAVIMLMRGDGGGRRSGRRGGTSSLQWPGEAAAASRSGQALMTKTMEVGPRGVRVIGGGQTAAVGVGVPSDDDLKFLRRTGSSVNSLSWPIQR